MLLNLDDAAQADRVFAALAENGAVQMPIQETFWAARFGMLVDQFGTPWLINCGKAHEEPRSSPRRNTSLVNGEWIHQVPVLAHVAINRRMTPDRRIAHGTRMPASRRRSSPWRELSR